MEVAHEANVEFVVISGSTISDTELDSLTDVIRHALRTQFACKKVTISIEENISPDEQPPDGMCYY